MPKLAILLILAAALGGCITPQELYKGRLAELSCEPRSPQGEAPAACEAGRSAGAGFAAVYARLAPAATP